MNALKWFIYIFYQVRKYIEGNITSQESRGSSGSKIGTVICYAGGGRLFPVAEPKQGMASNSHCKRSHADHNFQFNFLTFF